MRIDLEVTAAGTTEQVSAGPADMIALERRFNITATQLQESAAIEHLAFLAWHALRRTRAGVPDFDAWVNSDLEDLDAVPGNAEAGQPT